MDLNALIASRRPNAPLPRPFYTDPSVYSLDLERIHLRHWLFAGFTFQIPSPGDYLLFEFAGEPLILTRDADRRIHALYNVCRHRGSRICSQPSGNAKSLACQYHRWTYSLDGSLIAARHMPGNFDKENYSLERAHIRVLEGLVFVCLAEDPPDFRPVERDVTPHLRPHRLERAKVCHTWRYAIEANWKLVVENARECYHCGPAHPEYCRAMGFAAALDSPRIAAEDEVISAERGEHWKKIGLHTTTVDFGPDTWHHAIRFPFRPGFVSQSLDGAPVAPLMGDLREPDAGAVAVVIHPTFWFEASSDYAMVQRFLPAGPERTEVEMHWLVDGQARQGADYEVERVTAFWRITAEQDKRICEENQAGVRSRAYRPGVYAPSEAEVDKFISWYLRRLT